MLIPNIDVKSSAQRLEEKLDRIIELLELLCTTQLYTNGTSVEHIAKMLGPKK